MDKRINMKTKIELLKEERNTLCEKIDSVNNEIKELDKKVKQELSDMDLVKGLVEYIRFKEYPTEVYSVFSIDRGDRDQFRGIQLKVVYDYGYTDVVGLTKEQFEELRKLLWED